VDHGALQLESAARKRTAASVIMDGSKTTQRYNMSSSHRATMTPEDFDRIQAIVAAAEQRMTERQERSMEALTANLSDLRDEMNARFETVDRRFEALERRFERTSETLRSIDTRMGALTKWADTLDRDNLALANTQAGQQRAIDDLAARVANLERGGR